MYSNLIQVKKAVKKKKSVCLRYLCVMCMCVFQINMLLTFSMGEDCPCPEDIQEELYDFHNELRLHCGEMHITVSIQPICWTITSQYRLHERINFRESCTDVELLEYTEIGQGLY